MSTFLRYRIYLDNRGQVERRIEEVRAEKLQENELLVRVAYSSLNYKDALASNGNRGISRNYPHTPGIDASGTVMESTSPQFTEGQNVIISGYDFGMNTSGGFSQFITVPARWASPLPEGLSLKESMILGTAGLTAAMCLDRLLPARPENVVISGASGGVGTLAILLLKHLGIPTVAVSRKDPAALLGAGASQVLAPWAPSEKPLLKGVYSAGIDTVGGDVLSSMIKHIKPYGGIAVCGMALSPSFTTSVFPFILRGINLYGIESAEAALSWKNELWEKLGSIWKPPNLESICRTVNLATLEPEIEKMLSGSAQGRVLIDLETGPS
jgi:acrylyl-CoA reductase (NADPH)